MVQTILDSLGYAFSRVGVALQFCKGGNCLCFSEIVIDEAKNEYREKLLHFIKR